MQKREKGKKKGKSVVYSLTTEGKKEAKDATDYFCHTYRDIFENRF